MNSLFAKILLWFYATLIFTIIGSALVSAIDVDISGRRPLFSHMLSFQLEEARAAFETGGRDALRGFLGRLEAASGAEAILTDASGRDLLTGQDRSGMLASARRRRHSLSVFRRERTLVALPSQDGRYWLLQQVPNVRVGAWFLLPEHWLVMGAAVFLCYWLAYHLTAPVRRLQKAVERFGRGDLSARAGSSRRDELGQLARTFDQMADRIETLLAAERRLLLDISHELRSPLARLGVAVELARSGDDRDAALNRIQKESDRLNELVGELLEVTRAEGDPGALRTEPVRLDQLLQELAEDSAIEAGARGCSVRLLPSGPITVAGDSKLLQRAVENVVRNAIRFAPKDTAVEIALERNGSSGVVRVRDYGPGVPEEALQRIFDAFYRVESDRNRTSGGAGLGLAIARRAVELHKGRIHAQNAHPGLLLEIELPVSP